MLEKAVRVFKNIFLLLVLVFCYLPLVYALVFSFNEASKKESISETTLTLSTQGYVSLFGKDLLLPFINSFLISLILSLFVCFLALITCFALWWRNNQFGKKYVSITSQITIINPDIITAVALSFLFSVFFGVLKTNQEGFWRLVIAYTVIALPYCIFIMLPFSRKFPRYLFEASLDLGFGFFKTFCKTYIRFMFPAILSSILICFVFTFDDFIIARVVANVNTFGIQLYQQKQLKTWVLALATIFLLITLIYLFFKSFFLVFNNFSQQNKTLKEKWKSVVGPEKLFVILFAIFMICLLVSFATMFILGALR